MPISRVICCLVASAALTLAGAWLSGDRVSLLQTQATIGDGRGLEWPRPGDPSMEITSGHRWLVATFKTAAKAKDVGTLNASVIGTCCVPVRLNIEEGVYDVVFDVLREYQDDEFQYVQQSAWRGLSDQSGTKLGSRVIANVGGPNKGIEYMVHQMQAHPKPYYALCADHLTLKYEIMACISGLMNHDHENVWGPAAVQAGLLEQVVYTMRVEPDLIATQATGCRVMQPLLLRNPQYVAPLVRMGALQAVETAMERFKDGDNTPFHFGYTVGQFYDIKRACAEPHRLLLAGSQ